MSSLAEAVAAHKSGDLARAEQIYRGILKRERQNFDANNLLGTLCCQQERFTDGLPFLERAVKLRPQSTGALVNLGHALVGTGRYEEAETAYRKALSQAPAELPAWRALARLLVRSSRIVEAETLLQEAKRNLPGSAELLAELGELQAAAGKVEPAIDSLRQALSLAPRHARALRQLAICRASVGNYIDSIPVLESIPPDADVLLALARAYRVAQRPEEALKAIQRLETISPDRLDAKIVRANLLSDLGRGDEANAAFRTLLSSPGVAPEAFYGLALAGAIEAGSDEEAHLIQLAESPPAEPEARRLIHFAAGHVRDRNGDHDGAFAFYDAAHQADAVKFDAESYLSFVDHMIAVFDKTFVKSLARHGSEDRRPVFIVGMPRSGTSLVEQILSAHPAVGGAGELEEIRYIARSLGFSHSDPSRFTRQMAIASPIQIAGSAAFYLKALDQRVGDAQRVTDKMPHNFELLGLIGILFPRSRVVHCQRDPLDTCVSIYSHNLGQAHAYAADLATLGTYYRSYKRLIDHWCAVLDGHILSVTYEDLVHSPEREVARLLEFLELPWDDRCLDFHKNERSITTFSRQQVRQPIYSSSIGRWKRHAHHLGKLMDALRTPETSVGYKD